jgi:DNA-binding response OmpR family regulator
LLRELATHAGKVMAHRDLLTRGWGPAYRDDVDYMRNLRRKWKHDSDAGMLW